MFTSPVKHFSTLLKFPVKFKVTNIHMLVNICNIEKSYNSYYRLNTKSWYEVKPNLEEMAGWETPSAVVKRVFHSVFR